MKYSFRPIRRALIAALPAATPPLSALPTTARAAIRVAASSLLTALVLFGSATVQAATFTVTNNTNSGAGSGTVLFSMALQFTSVR